MSATHETNMEDGTHELDAPPEESRLEVLVLGQLTTLEDLDGVDDRHTAVESPVGNIVVNLNTIDTNIIWFTS